MSRLTDQLDMTLVILTGPLNSIAAHIGPDKRRYQENIFLFLHKNILYGFH